MEKPIQPLFIGICGGSGSGKSYFLERVQENFPDDEVCVISLDDYYKPIEHQRKDENGKVNFDLPDSFDEPLLYQHIQEILSGKTIIKEKYNFNNPHLSPSLLTFKKAAIIVLEGIFIFHFTRITALIDIKVFIDSKNDLSLNRRILRDEIERALSKEEVIYQWNHHVLPSYEKFALPYRNQADLIIQNHEDPLDIHPLIKLIELKRSKTLL